MRNSKKNPKADHLTPQWLTKLRLEILVLKKERDSLEKELLAPPKMKKGTVTIQYKTCGRKTCRCYDKKDPVKHGPYYYLVVQNNKAGVRQQLIKDVKERELFLNYRTYQERLKEYQAISEKIFLLYESLKKKRAHG